MAIFSYPSAISQMGQQATCMMSDSSISISVGAQAASENRETKASSGASSLSSASVQKTDIFLYNQEIEGRKILAWPAISALFEGDVQQIPDWDGESDGGERWLTKVAKAVETPLPTDEAVDFVRHSA
jgi:hypothetical protein